MKKLFGLSMKVECKAPSRNQRYMFLETTDQNLNTEISMRFHLARRRHTNDILCVPLVVRKA
jgi:hypothetical protein